MEITPENFDIQLNHLKQRSICLLMGDEYVRFVEPLEKYNINIEYFVSQMIEHIDVLTINLKATSTQQLEKRFIIKLKNAMSECEDFLFEYEPYMQLDELMQNVTVDALNKLMIRLEKCVVGLVDDPCLSCENTDCEANTYKD